MKLHEYQGKELLRKHGVATLAGGAARTVDEAVAVAESLGGTVWVRMVERFLAKA
jgi:succinyl-CoA synthetase beta subunit